MSKLLDKFKSDNQPELARALNEIVDAINFLNNNTVGKLVEGRGITIQSNSDKEFTILADPDKDSIRKKGFEVYFSSSDAGVKIYVHHAYVVSPSALKNNSLAYAMPVIGDIKLDDEDETPSITKGDGNWIVRLYLSTGKAEIKVEDADDEDLTIDPKFKVIPIATFTLGSGDVTKLKQLVLDDVLLDGSSLHPFQGVIYDRNFGKLTEAGDPKPKDMKFVLGKGSVINKGCNEGYFIKDVQAPDGSLSGIPYEENDLGSDGDFLFLKIETDENDNINSSEITTEWGASPPEQTASAKASPDESGQTGEYYLPILSIHGDDDTGWYIKQIMESAILWEGKEKIANVGGGARIFKEFDADSCESRLRSLLPTETLSGSEAQPLINITVVEDGEVIRIGATQNTQGSGYGVNGTMTFVDCDNVEQGKIVVANGIVTDITNTTLTLGNCSGGDTTIPSGP